MKNTILKLLMISVLFLTFNSCQKKKTKFTIGILQIIESQVLDAAKVEIIKALEDAGYKDGDKIEIEVKNAQGDISNIPMILQYFKTSQVDLVITIGTPCMVGAAQRLKDIPVVYTVAFSPEQMGFKKPSNMTGIYDPFSMDRFFDSIKLLTPDITKLGILFNTAEPNAAYAASIVKKQCIKRNYELLETGVESTADITQATEMIINKGAQAIIVSADNKLYNTLETIVQIANKSKIPVYTTETDVIRKGVFAAVGVDYADWGYKAGQIAADIIGSKVISTIPEILYLDYKFVVNKNSSDLLGIQLSDSQIAQIDSMYYP